MCVCVCAQNGGWWDLKDARITTEAQCNVHDRSFESFCGVWDATTFFMPGTQSARCLFLWAPVLPCCCPPTRNTRKQDCGVSPLMCASGFGMWGACEHRCA